MVRDPHDRALSCFEHWKCGSKKCRRDKKFLEKFESLTLEGHLEMVRAGDRQLFHGATWSAHCKPTGDWLQPAACSKATVIGCASDMSHCLSSLFKHIGVPHKGEKIEQTNVSSRSEDDLVWTARAKELVLLICEKDF